MVTQFFRRRFGRVPFDTFPKKTLVFSALRCNLRVNPSSNELDILHRLHVGEHPRHAPHRRHAGQVDCCRTTVTHHHTEEIAPCVNATWPLRWWASRHRLRGAQRGGAIRHRYEAQPRPKRRRGKASRRGCAFDRLPSAVRFGRLLRFCAEHLRQHLGDVRRSGACAGRYAGPREFAKRDRATFRILRPTPLHQ